MKMQTLFGVLAVSLITVVPSAHAEAIAGGYISVSNISAVSETTVNYMTVVGDVQVVQMGYSGQVVSKSAVTEGIVWIPANIGSGPSEVIQKAREACLKFAVLAMSSSDKSFRLNIAGGAVPAASNPLGQDSSLPVWNFNGNSANILSCAIAR
ncbi:MAG: hypothetical protein A2X94_03510 [Bdellovibrionales bacterium GWB1_55_8]|nr:MAG: hypothetical protein A2X94_03510 [Bdellovibrionales bacterium GWB1_55_8]